MRRETPGSAGEEARVCGRRVGWGGLVVGRLRHSGDGPGRDGTGHGVGWGGVG